MTNEFTEGENKDFTKVTLNVPVKLLKQFKTIADIKLFTDDVKIDNGLINFHKYYDKKKYQAVSFVNVQNKLPLRASIGEDLLKQLKA